MFVYIMPELDCDLFDGTGPISCFFMITGASVDKELGDLGMLWRKNVPLTAVACPEIYFQNCLPVFVVSLFSFFPAALQHQ